MKTIEELKTEIEELTDALKESDKSALDWEEAHDELEKELTKKDEEIWELENKISEQPDLTSLVDQEKYDLFIEHFQKFTLEQFETFLNQFIK